MGFLDKAKAAASDLAAKADTALAGSGLTGGPKPAGAGDVDKFFHDLGVLTYLEASGRPADPADRARVMTSLQELDASGAIRSFALHTAPLPAPGMAGAVPPPPGMAGTTAPPPPFGAGGPPAPRPPQAPAPVPQAPPAPPVAAPPPPSWMTPGDGGNV